MSFLDIVERARSYLQKQQRISLRALRREFELDDELLEELIEELVDIQRVAVREGQLLAWTGTPAADPVGVSVAAPSTPTGRDPRAYTPRHLAEKILRSKSAVEGERKQVTVLFADVKGSTELAEQLDPEDWHRILDRFFEVLAEGIHRFEGTVNQYTGDGVMALFGAPIALEDHAQRACYAALHLQGSIKAYADELRVSEGVAFAVRMGLNSGEVVVGKIGDDLRMDYTAQGATVNLAARMQTLADPGKPLLAQNTSQLVEGYFELRDLGESKVRGIAAPVRIAELEGVGAQRTRLDRSRAHGLSQFVGRARESEMLESALEQAMNGSGRVVGVVADAGTGKSRLCAEFVDDCRRKGLRVNTAHCPAHGRSMPFLPVLQLLRNQFEITERDSDREARRKIAGDLTLLGGDFQGVLPVLFDFLGIPDPAQPPLDIPAEARQRQLFAFVRYLAQARSERESGVLFIDDLHWIDSGSDAFLAQLVDVARATRTLVLVNFRPEYRADWMQQTHYQQIPLAPLGEPEMSELLTHLLGTADSLSGLSERIYSRTGGNPFFAEEIVQGLIDRGTLAGSRGAFELASPVERIEIPATVHAVLAARIDRLAEREKRVLQAAAVVGREVAESVLASIVDIEPDELALSLSNLKDSEFLFEQSLLPEIVYSFKHALTRDVAYESQLQGQRRRLHARVAQHLEERDSGRLDEMSGLLAQHCEAGGMNSEATRWHVRAAEFAGLADIPQAVWHFERARELGAAETSDEMAELVLRACMKQINYSSRYLSDEQTIAAAFEQGRTLAKRLGATASLSALLGHYAAFRMMIGDASADSLAMVADAVALGEESGSDEAWLSARYRQIWARILPMANFGLAAELTAALKDDMKGRTLPSMSMLGFDFELRLVFLTLWADCLRGNVHSREQEAQNFETLLERAKSLGDVECEQGAYMYGTISARIRGDAAQTRHYARRGIAFAEEIGSRAPPMVMHLECGLMELDSASWGDALTEFEAADRGELLKAAVLAGRGLAEYQQGRRKRGRQLSNQAMTILREHGPRSYHDTQVYKSRIQLLVAEDARGNEEEILEQIAALAAYIDEIDFQADAPSVHLARAELAEALGEDDACARSQAAARRGYLAIGAIDRAERLTTRS